MRLDKLAISAQTALQNALSVASEAESATIEPIHLLKALIEGSENNFSAIIKRIGADPALLKANINEAIAAMPKQQGSAPLPIPSSATLKTLDNAVALAEKNGRQLCHQRTRSYCACKRQNAGRKATCYGRYHAENRSGSLRELAWIKPHYGS